MRQAKLKSVLLGLLLSSVTVVLLGQGKPYWTNVSVRENNYPQRSYFTGYIEGNVRTNETLEAAKSRLLKEAQGLLTESIRVTVTSRTSSQSVSTRTGQSEQLDAVFASSIQTVSDAEIAGIHSEPAYYDTETGVVYAFAYVNRFELTGYYKSNLAMTIMQVEGLLQTAHDLEAASEKAKARRQCESAKPLLAKVRIFQDLLTAIDVNISPDALQQVKTEMLHNRLTQMLAQLAQAVFVHVVCIERNFSNPTTVIGNRVKSTLSAKGCSFTDDPAQADFLLRLEATTRYHGDDRGFITCYADIAINLIDTRKEKNVFNDEFSQKGVTISQESAGRKALEDAVPTIVQKISPWIEN
jgi:hypothetical protein